MANGGILDPQRGHLLITAKLSDVMIFDNDDDTVTIGVDNLKDGIEVVHEHDRLWWPV